VGAFQPYILRDIRTGPHTYDLWITDPYAAAWYNSDCLDLPEIAWCLAHIREGMTIADCGAHHGCLSVVFSKAAGPSGKVMAWEALPKNASVIEKNFALNQCANAVVRPYALGEKHEIVRLQSDQGNAVYRNDNSEMSATETIDIQCVRLDEEISRGINIDFIKIDVEGSELQMMRGSQRILSHRPIIDLEIHNHLFSHRSDTLTEISGMLSPLNYIYSLLPQPRGIMQPMGWDLDLSELAKYDNPHLFCVPVWGGQTQRRKRKWW
jgi:FkbM family methyltransferase